MYTVCVDTLYTGSGLERSVCLSYPWPSGEHRLDLRGYGSIAVPGVIDIHVHLRGLGQGYKEDEESGTRAAARGGVVVVADMPNTVPPLRTVEALEAKLEALREKSIVDYAVYAGIPEDPGEAARLAAQPVAGFKVYPEDYGRGESICSAMREAAARGLLVVVHPEDPELLWVETGWDRWVARGCAAEKSAVLYMQSLWEGCGRPRIHYTHISCPETLEYVAALSKATRRVSGDTTPHHLLAWSREPRGLDTCYSKVNPPIRGFHSSNKLFQVLLREAVDGATLLIASDHAPHADWEKRMHPLLCPPGVPGLDYWPSLILALLAPMGFEGLRLFYTLTHSNPLKALLGPGTVGSGVERGLAVYAPWWRVGARGFSRASYHYYFMEAGWGSLFTAVRSRPVYAAGEGVLVEPGHGANIVEEQAHL